MARPAYSLNFLSLAGLTGTATIPVPDSSIYVVRDVCAYNGGGIEDALIYFEDGDTTGTWLAWGNVDLESYVGHWEGRQVFQPGGSILVRVAGGAWDVRVSGYNLDAP